MREKWALCSSLLEHKSTYLSGSTSKPSSFDMIFSLKAMLLRQTLRGNQIYEIVKSKAALPSGSGETLTLTWMALQASACDLSSASGAWQEWFYYHEHCLWIQSNLAYPVFPVAALLTHCNALLGFRTAAACTRRSQQITTAIDKCLLSPCGMAGIVLAVRIQWWVTILVHRRMYFLMKPEWSNQRATEIPASPFLLSFCTLGLHIHGVALFSKNQQH